MDREKQAPGKAPTLSCRFPTRLAKTQKKESGIALVRYYGDYSLLSSLLTPRLPGSSTYTLTRFPNGQGRVLLIRLMG